MGCRYWVGDVTIPKARVADVRKRIEELSLESNVHVDEHEWQKNGATLTMDSGEMGNSDAEELDVLLDEIAEMIVGTKFEGQIVSYQYEDSKGDHVLICGQRHEIGEQTFVADTPIQLEIGQTHKIGLICEVLGMPGKKGILLRIVNRGSAKTGS